MVPIKVDGRSLLAEAGEKLLWELLANGIYIPHLCAIRERPSPEASCRLCFVEIAGRSEPVTACTEPVVADMEVNTRGEASRSLVRTNFELLMASHDLDCASCPANGGCELPKIARYLGVSLNPKRFRRILPNLPGDCSHPAIGYDPNKCVLCAQCVWACRQRGAGILGFGRRGFKRVVTTFADRPLAESGCLGCGACVDACPAGAFFYKTPKE